MRKKWKEKLDHWCYFGYSRETLAAYDAQIAADNLRIFAKALCVAAVVTVIELIVVILLALSGQGNTDSLWDIFVLMLAALVAIGVLGVIYRRIRNAPGKAMQSRILTTVFLALWSLLYIFLGTVIDPDDYAVMACGLFLLVQVMFDAYPADNLTFVSSAYLVFAALGFMYKPRLIFLYDMVDALPFLLVGLFLSWTKSRAKWSSLINADAMLQLKTQKLENELIQMRISIMLSQIQPHFLYNALGAIQQLCKIDPPTAGRATMEFSMFLRGNMDALTCPRLISFEEELGHTRHYLMLEQLRFQDALKIDYDIHTTEFYLPTLTLQPIVENAVRYGVTKREEGGTVCISTCETAAAFVITVKDDGVGFDSTVPKEDGRTHVGISNVNERLRQMCGGTLHIESRPGVGTTATITIPKER